MSSDRSMTARPQASIGAYRQHLVERLFSAMLAERLDASAAAFRVGYESASQFSREYSRQFGAPPMRDIAALRQEPAGVSG